MAFPSIANADTVMFPLIWPAVIINMALLLMSILILLESFRKKIIERDEV